MKCFCGSGKESRQVHDSQGVYLLRVCDSCEEKQLKKLRPVILTGYTQEAVDEPIEPE